MTEKLSADNFLAPCPECGTNVLVIKSPAQHVDFECEDCGKRFDEYRTVMVGKASSREDVYHTTDECHYVREQMAEWNRKEAEEWGLSQCNLCKQKERGTDD